MSTSSAPPIASTQPPISARYAFPSLPHVPESLPERQVIDAFKLAVAKVVAEAWDEDPAKIYAGVDTGPFANNDVTLASQLTKT